MKSFTTTEPTDDKQLWAFAIYRDGRVSRRPGLMGNPVNDRGNYIVTACSPSLKARGVQAGMRFSEARKLAPDMRLLVTNR